MSRICCKFEIKFFGAPITFSCFYIRIAKCYYNGETRSKKPKFTDVFCPNKDCKLYGISGKGNITGNGTYQVKNKIVRKLYLPRNVAELFNDRTGTFFDNVRKDEFIVRLALKMILKGMSIQAIADALEVQSGLQLVDGCSRS